MSLVISEYREKIGWITANAEKDIDFDALDALL